MIVEFSCSLSFYSMNSSQRKKEAVRNFVDTVLKKRKYHELEKTSSGETGSSSTPYVHSVQDLALEQSVLAETTANGSVLALCGREPTPQDLFDSFKRLIHFSSDVSRSFCQEIKNLVFPLFVNIVIDLLTRAGLTSAEEFVTEFFREVPSKHITEAEELKDSLTSTHTLPKSLVDKYHTTAHLVPLSNVAFKHLLQFLEFQDNTSIFVLIQKYINIEVFGTSTAVHSEVPVEVKKTSQKKKETARSSEATVRPSETGRDSAAQGADHNGEIVSSSLDVDVGSQHLSPLTEFKDALKDASKSCTTIPSVCMYWTVPSLNSCCLGNKLLIGGFEDSSIHIWCLCGCDEKDGCLPAECPIQWEDLYARKPIIGGSSPILSARASCHTTLHGHSGPVYSVDTTQNGCHLFSSSEDSSIRLWDLTRSTCVAAYKGHSYPVFDISLSPVGVHFATASYDRTARLWSCDVTYPIRMFAGHSSSVDVVRFHGNCNYIATGSSDHTCRLWDVQSGQCVRLFSNSKSPVTMVMFSDDGKTLFSGHANGTLQQLDIGQGYPIAVYKGLSSRVVSIGQTKDGRYISGASSVGELVTWNSPDQSESGKPTTQSCLSSSTLKLSNVVLKNAFFTHKNRIVCISTKAS